MTGDNRTGVDRLADAFSTAERRNVHDSNTLNVNTGDSVTDDDIVSGGSREGRALQASRLRLKADAGDPITEEERADLVARIDRLTGIGASAATERMALAFREETTRAHDRLRREFTD